MIDFTRGASRDRLEHDAAVDLLGKQVLIPDERRRRPFYFDGRFLTAADLTREQTYFLEREADLGQAGGSGVINGLDVKKSGAGALDILPGNGITPEGEIVTIIGKLTIRLSDIADDQKLDAAFGIAALPQTPPVKRSGVFILALRPVEFTANPITAYPTSLTGPRRVEDGDIVEAVAVTLIPYADETGTSDVARQRTTIARNLFIRQAALTASVNALPLAMVSLSQSVINWVDPFLVRREVGATHGDTLGLGFAPRALREAQFLQYTQHLTDVLQARKAALQPLKFTATDYFLALPPAGPFPAATFDPAAMTQSFFPPTIAVEVAVIPDDELRSVVEDALLLPPIDTTLTAAELESTSVLILAPLPRTEIANIDAALKDPPKPGVALLPQPRPVPQLLAGRKPLETLTALRLSAPALPIERRTLPVDDRWKAALARVQTREAASGLPELWYVRRRNLAYNPTLAGQAQSVSTDSLADQQTLVKAIATAGLTARFDALRGDLSKITARALALMLETLSRPGILSEIFTTVVAFELYERVAAERGLDAVAANRIAAQLSGPKFGQGFAELIALQPEFKLTSPTEPAAARVLANAQRIVELDAFFTGLDPDSQKKLAALLLPLAQANKLDDLNTLLNKVLDGGPIA
jgi:hypothetical protein